ncbi:hypothetical protein BH10PSE2_BH10PSE2_19890 [soil metagenome]
MRPVEPIVFSKDEMRDMVRRLQDYFDAEMDQEVGVLPAEMLIACMARDLGPAFYNRGLHDAHGVFSAKAEEMADAIYALERKPGAG